MEMSSRKAAWAKKRSENCLKAIESVCAVSVDTYITCILSSDCSFNLLKVGYKHDAVKYNHNHNAYPHREPLNRTDSVTRTKDHSTLHCLSVSTLSSTQKHQNTFRGAQVHCINSSFFQDSLTSAVWSAAHWRQKSNSCDQRRCDWFFLLVPFSH